MGFLSVVVLSLSLLVGGAVRASEVKPDIIALPSGSAPLRLVAQTDQGPIWFCSRGLGALGSVETSTGAVDLVSLGQGAKPASVTFGNGRLFAVDAAADVIHEVQPETQELVRHAISSNLGHLELNAAAFDTDGRLWFTGYAGVYGRLDLKTGESAIWPAPGGRGSVALTSGDGGALWFASYTQSHIARLDPGHAQVETFALPSGHEGPKSIAVDGRGRVFVAAHRSGSLLRFDPASREWSAWRLPGRDPKPYAVMVDGKGRVWITDVGEAALLRFEPESETVVVTAATSGSRKAAPIRS